MTTTVADFAIEPVHETVPGEFGTLGSVDERVPDLTTASSGDQPREKAIVEPGDGKVLASRRGAIVEVWGTEALAKFDETRVAFPSRLLKSSGVPVLIGQEFLYEVREATDGLRYQSFEAVAPVGKNPFYDEIVASFDEMLEGTPK